MSFVGSVFHRAEQALRAWRERERRQAATRARELIMDPNRGSDLKVERYSFGLKDNIDLGTPKAIFMSTNPETAIRPQRVTTNAPMPGFVLLTDIKMANVSCIIGDCEDAWNYNPNSMGNVLDMPTIEPAHRVTVLGNYTGLIPEFYGDKVDFVEDIFEDRPVYKDTWQRIKQVLVPKEIRREQVRVGTRVTHHVVKRKNDVPFPFSLSVQGPATIYA